MTPKKVSVLGSGNWGSAIARLIGINVLKFPALFDPQVKMWVYEEIINGRKLTEIINTEHENVKYLPGKKFSGNVIAVPDVVDAGQDADVLIFVIPHQFIRSSYGQLKGKLKPGAQGLTLVKGFALGPDGGVTLISEQIQAVVGPLTISVLMGANLAGEVAENFFCETTIGCRDADCGLMFKQLFESDNFRVTVVNDAATVEMCGALKNIVAVGAGFVDGLKLGDNTKAAVIRIGLMEMIRYVREFGDPPQLATFFESCGVADLVTTCYGGRNRRIGEQFVHSGKSIKELEDLLLNGQKSQGPETAAEVNVMLKSRNLEDSFPLFTAIHRICMGEMNPDCLIDCLRNHPVHESSEKYTNF